jgi:hypothetical protein
MPWRTGPTGEHPLISYTGSSGCGDFRRVRFFWQPFPCKALGRKHDAYAVHGNIVDKLAEIRRDRPDPPSLTDFSLEDDAARKALAVNLECAIFEPNFPSH